MTKIAKQTCKICSLLVEKGLIEKVCLYPRNCPHKQNPEAAKIAAKQKTINNRTKGYREKQKNSQTALINAAGMLPSTSGSVMTSNATTSVASTVKTFESFQSQFLPTLDPRPCTTHAIMIAYLIYVIAGGDPSKYDEKRREIDCLNFASLAHSEFNRHGSAQLI